MWQPFRGRAGLVAFLSFMSRHLGGLGKWLTGGSIESDSIDLKSEGTGKRWFGASKGV